MMLLNEDRRCSRATTHPYTYPPRDPHVSTRLDPKRRNAEAFRATPSEPLQRYVSSLRAGNAYWLACPRRHLDRLFCVPIHMSSGTISALYGRLRDGDSIVRHVERSRNQPIKVTCTETPAQHSTAQHNSTHLSRLHSTRLDFERSRSTTPTAPSSNSTPSSSPSPPPYPASSGASPSSSPSASPRFFVPLSRPAPVPAP
jgi:hypothetical protein